MATETELELYNCLKALYDDLVECEDDRNPESGEEYARCEDARKILEKYKGIGELSIALDKGIEDDDDEEYLISYQCPECGHQWHEIY